MTDKPTRPPVFVQHLYALGVIHTIKVSYCQIDTDETSTYITFTSKKGTSRYLRETVIEHIDFTPDWRSACRLHPQYQAEARRWLDWTKQEEKELEEYIRLKQKFEGKITTT